MKKKKDKKRINKVLLKLLCISIVLLIVSLYILKDNNNQIAISVIIATIPYGYVILDFLDEKRFSKFGKFSLFISILVRFILGAFIGVAASIVVIGKYLLQDIQEWISFFV